LSSSTARCSRSGSVLQANSGTNTPSDLKAIGTQIQTAGAAADVDANTKNDAGQYLFSGYMQSTQPFVRGAAIGNLCRRQRTSTIALDSGTSVQTGDPGSGIYMNIPAGNGTFTTAAGAGNTGTGVIDTGSVTDPQAGSRPVHDQIYRRQRLRGAR